MSYRAEIDVAGKIMDILSCEFEFNRDIDSKGRASSRVYGGQFTVQVESTANTMLLEQMLNNQYLPFDGSVVFYKGDEDDAEMKKLEFKRAYMIHFNEKLDILGKNPMLIELTITAEELLMGPAAYNGGWPVA